MAIRPKRPATSRSKGLSSPISLTEGKRRKTELLEIDVADEYRRANGVYELCQKMMTKPEQGKSYHILTGGNVDMLSHLQWLMLHWKKIRRVFVTAFVMSAVEIQLCRQWLQDGTIGTLEVMLGDLFARQYKQEWLELTNMYEAGLIGNIFTSRIHAKIMLIEAADGTKIVIESSANCNMNPRIEQSCVTVNAELFDFYDVYLHEVLYDEESRYTERETKKMIERNGNETNLDDDERIAVERQD